MKPPVEIVPVLRTHEVDDATIGIIAVHLGEDELTIDGVRNGPALSVSAFRSQPAPTGPPTVIDTATGATLRMAGGSAGGGREQQRFRAAFGFTSRPEQIAILGPDETPIETIELTPAAPITDPAAYAEAGSLDFGPATMSLISANRHQFLPRGIDPVEGSTFTIREATADPVAVEHFDGHFVMLFLASGVVDLAPMGGLDRITLDGVSTGVPAGATGNQHAMWVRIVFPGEFEPGAETSRD